MLDGSLPLGGPPPASDEKSRGSWSFGDGFVGPVGMEKTVVARRASEVMVIECMVVFVQCYCKESRVMKGPPCRLYSWERDRKRQRKQLRDAE